MPTVKVVGWLPLVYSLSWSSEPFLIILKINYINKEENIEKKMEKRNEKARENGN